MLGLGRQVLQKIQNLLVEVDQQNIAAHHRKKKHRKFSPPLESTVNEQNKENLEQQISERIQKLYMNHFEHEEKILDKKFHQMNEQIKANRPFKVENKISKFLNEKHKRKPIYQRVSEVLLQRQKSIDKIRSQLPKSKQEIEEQQIQKFLQSQQINEKKYTKEQFQRKIQEMSLRNLKRTQKLHKQQLNYMERKKKQIMQKPQINQQSKSLWEKKKSKKNLSKNVLQRFEQYNYEKKKNWEQFLKNRQQEQTPFTPRLSQVTKILAEKSRSRKSLFEKVHIDKMIRSKSCRAMKSKQNQHRISILQEGKNRKTQRGDSKKEPYRHGKSNTTLNTSRHQNLSTSRKQVNQNCSLLKKLY